MPIYEYFCQDCQAEISIWFSSVAQAAATAPSCTACGGEHLTRLVSSFAIARSGGAAIGRHPGSSPSAGHSRGDDPQALAQTMRAASAGQDMGKDFNEVARRLEQGESATAIEAALRKRVGEDMQTH